MRSQLESWARRLAERQHFFVPPELRSAIQFLHGARVYRKGWGAFPGMSSDLHHTACAVQALSQCKDESSIGLAADGAIYLRETINGGLSKLSIGQLAGLAAALGCEDNPDKEYLGQFLRAAQIRLEQLMASGDEYSLLAVSRLLSESAGLNLSREYISPWLDRILEQQRLDDGGWPIFPGQAASPLATAAVVELLSHISTDESRSAQVKAVGFIQGYIEANGWQTIYRTGGTYEHATLLRALAESDNSDFGFVVIGSEELIARVNPDGGWGGGPGEASNVESTSLSIIALVAAGYTSFVPARLTFAALHDTRLILENAELERDKLVQDFEQKVQRHCGKVVKERDQLRDRISSLTERLQVAELTTGEERAKWVERLAQNKRELEERIAHYRSFSSDRSLPARVSFFVLVGVGSLSIASLLLMLWEYRESPFVLLTVMTIGIIFFSLRYYLLSYRRYQKTPEWAELGETLDERQVREAPLASLRAFFRHCTEGLDAPVREEVIYRLFRDVFDMPPDVGRRYMEDLAFRLDLPAHNAILLTRWLEQVLELRPKERKLLFEQIRRAIFS